MSKDDISRDEELWRKVDETPAELGASGEELSYEDDEEEVESDSNDELERRIDAVIAEIEGPEAALKQNCDLILDGILGACLGRPNKRESGNISLVSSRQDGRRIKPPTGLLRNLGRETTRRM